MNHREPAPDWIPYATDEWPSDAMPEAGHKDWRAQAEWWKANAIYWREQWEKECVLHGGRAASQKVL